jgi:hypothetical protein
MSLISDAEKLKANDAYYSEFISYLAIEQALQLGNCHDAWMMATAAVATLGLGWKRQARNLILRTMHACETYGDAALLKDLYSTGAQVTGDARLKRRAKELADLLTA